jgi:tRNA/tmRNA/rRNA uracil-C5-methylase (TrmA/RlmC/RlmD family)
MKLLKTRAGDVFMGFSPVGRNRVVEATACPIALPAISDFLPELKRQAGARLPVKYRNANLVIKSGDDGRVFWGGIGRRSLKMNEADYLWTAVRGRRIYYSLDTFFQANLSILPVLMEYIIDLGILGPDISFFDLYGGVGLFGIALSDQVKEVILVEENVYATRCAAYNAAVSQCGHFKIIPGRIENVPFWQPAGRDAQRQVAIVDPPRQGLHQDVAAALAREKSFRHLLYLSCHMDSLARDLKIFLAHQWVIEKITPFDFFPKTRHLETLVLLSSR